MSQATKNKQHGDDKTMLKARKSFLDKGYFRTLSDKITEIADNLNIKKLSILDVGCGEGYYSLQTLRFLESKKKEVEMLCIDISKDALELFEKQPNLCKAVASAYSLPVLDASINLILNIFAPHSEDEFLRVLKPKSYLLKVAPLERHLFSLKECLYENAYLNEVEKFEFKHLKLLSSTEIRDRIVLKDKIDLANLFNMTPYSHKTSKEAKEKLENLDSFETEIEFGIYLFQKI